MCAYVWHKQMGRTGVGGTAGSGENRIQPPPELLSVTKNGGLGRLGLLTNSQ